MPDKYTVHTPRSEASNSCFADELVPDFREPFPNADLDITPVENKKLADSKPLRASELSTTAKIRPVASKIVEKKVKIADYKDTYSSYLRKTQREFKSSTLSPFNSFNDCPYNPAKSNKNSQNPEL